jgi:hypothetical protein
MPLCADILGDKPTIKQIVISPKAAIFRDDKISSDSESVMSPSANLVEGCSILDENAAVGCS